MRVIDLTQTFDGDMPVYPGDRKPYLRRIAEREREGFIDHELLTTMHVGTHIDAKSHMIEGGEGIAEIPAERCIGRGHLLDCRGHATISGDLLDGRVIAPGDIVLLLTGLSAKFRKPEYFEDFPLVSEDFAKRVVDFGVSMLGMDSPGPDHAPYPVHRLLLSNGVLILENLTNLESLLGIEKFQVLALPLKLQADAAPARVVAVLE